MNERILIIDDDDGMVYLVKTILKREGFEVETATRPEDGLIKALEKPPDLTILDVMMPDMDGWEVCRRLREISQSLIIFVTAKVENKDMLQGFALGADDYLTKPFENSELVARVKALLRRGAPAVAEDVAVFKEGELSVDFLRRQVTVRGQRVTLTPREYELMETLARNPERVMSASELVREAWGPEFDTPGAKDSLKMHMRYLSGKIERDPERPEYIIASRGPSYRLAAK